MTWAAVVAFQKANNLVADGIVGPATRATLDQAVAAKATPRFRFGKKPARPDAVKLKFAKYAVPALLTTRLLRKEYRDVYLDLNGAAVAHTKVFIEDPGADGLKADHNDNQPFDTYEADGKRIAFDADWKKQKLSKEEYLKAFAAADERYCQMLQALLAQLKQPS